MVNDLRQIPGHVVIHHNEVVDQDIVTSYRGLEVCPTARGIHSLRVTVGVGRIITTSQKVGAIEPDKGIIGIGESDTRGGGGHSGQDSVNRGKQAFKGRVLLEVLVEELLLIGRDGTGHIDGGKVVVKSVEFSDVARGVHGRGDVEAGGIAHSINFGDGGVDGGAWVERRLGIRQLTVRHKMMQRQDHELIIDIINDFT